MSKNYWIIEDWMSNHVYTDKRFDSFEEAREFISKVAAEEANTPLYFDESIYDGICEDLYAIEVNENGERVAHNE